MYNKLSDGPFSEWDERKNTANQRKHGVSFGEARSVFKDEYATEYFDLDHSKSEERFILWGMSERLRVLVISYCYRRNYSMVRMISVRKADKREEGIYWRGVP